jgi:hypothetical protein
MSQQTKQLAGGQSDDVLKREPGCLPGRAPSNGRACNETRTGDDDPTHDTHTGCLGVDTFVQLRHWQLRSERDCWMYTPLDLEDENDTDFS